jgi:predicted nucleic acid-binding protein
MPLVVDSSVVAKWILPAADSLKAVGLADGASTPLIILDLAPIEVANAIFVRQLRDKIPPDEATQFFEVLSSMQVQIVTSCDLLRRGLEIALKYRCAVYDALFVAAVEKLRCDGVTADERFYRAVAGDRFPDNQTDE